MQFSFSRARLYFSASLLTASTLLIKSVQLCFSQSQYLLSTVHCLNLPVVDGLKQCRSSLGRAVYTVKMMHLLRT